MTTLLNILDDYCRYWNFAYLRIDGQISSIDRDKRIEEFQDKNSDKWIFLISTRAGNYYFTCANIVIYMILIGILKLNLQAIDKAHRIGQNNPLTIYRFVCERTVEEKIVERAVKKLKIESFIIQKRKKYTK